MPGCFRAPRLPPLPRLPALRGPSRPLAGAEAPPLPLRVLLALQALPPDAAGAAERAQWAVHALLADDWLTLYASLDGMALALTRLSARLNMRGHGIELAPAVADFADHRAAFHQAFHEFFPQLRRHVEQEAVTRVD